MKRLLALCFLSASLLAPAALAQTEYTPARQHLYQMVFDAAKEDNQPLMAEYIAYKGNLNIQNDQGYTPLIYAAYYGHAQMVALLLKAGADPCLADKRGNNAMMGAIFKGNLAIAQQLMAAPCSVSASNKAQQTALMYAALFGRTEIAEALLKQGADAHAVDAQGNTALSLAENQVNEAMLKLLATHQTALPEGLPPGTHP